MSPWPSRDSRTTGHVQYRKATGKFYAKYRANGEQTTRLIGPAWLTRGRPPEGHFTRALAEVELHRMMAEATGASARDKSVRFADACAEYLRYVEHVRKIDIATVRDYRGVIDGYLVTEFGDRSIDTITPDLIDAYKERLISEGRLSARVIVRHLAVLHGIFKRAARAYGLDRNPASADLVERPRLVYTGEFDTFSGDEVELLASAAQDDQDGALYRVAAFTGLRQGELLALRWSDVDFVGGLLHVRRNYTDKREKMPKGKRVRSVPMTPRVIDTLARLKERGYLAEDGDLVFCNSAGGHLDSWALRRRYYRALEKAGLRRIRFHDLRHCFGSAAITKLDPYAVQTYMGHQHYSTTQRYLHHKPRPQDAAALHEAFGGDVISERSDPSAHRA